MTVVDASVWISVLAEWELRHEASRRWLASQSAVITIPALTIPEVAGAMARVTGADEDGRRAMSILLQTPRLRIVSLDRSIGELAGELAVIHRLRGADAVYVAVAQALGEPLATLDREIQQRAAGAVEIVVPPDG